MSTPCGDRGSRACGRRCCAYTHGFTFTGSAHFSRSATGSLVYISGPVSASVPPRDLALYDQSGGMETLNLRPMLYEFPRVSPNGQEVAVRQPTATTRMYGCTDLSRKSSLRQLTFQGRNRFPVWSGDGHRIAFQSDREGDLAIFAQPADGSRPAERLTKPERETAHVPQAWSPNDEYMLFSANTGSGFLSGPLPLEIKSRALRGCSIIDSISRRLHFHATADGWLTSRANSARIFIQSFPGTAATYPVPVDARHPRWSPDGTQLFFGQGPRIFTRRQ